MATTEVGSGPDVLTLNFDADAYQGNPHINVYVLVDGQFYTGNAIEWYEVTDESVLNVRGDFTGFNSFGITFIDDLYGGAPDADRNVILESATINGVAIPNSQFRIDAAGEAGPIPFDGDAQPPVVVPPVPGVTLNGTSGADTLAGGAGPDTLSGLGGDDVLRGLAGNDVLRGGAGSDVLDGGLGDDAITTNGGRDTVLWGRGLGADTVTDFVVGSDEVRLVGDGAGVVLATATREGAPGTVVSFPGDTATLWLPGATGLSLYDVIA